MIGLDVVLATADCEAAARFYREVLGGRVLEDPSVWRAGCAVGFGDQAIAFRPAAESRRSTARGLYDAIGLRVIALFVPDLDVLCDRLEAAGRRVATGVDLPGRLTVRFARDPDGNTLELIGLEGGACPTSPMQIGLTVRDAAASRAFYADTMGLPTQRPAPISKGVTRYGFDVGGATLKLWQPLGDTAALPRPAPGCIGIESVCMRVVGDDAMRAPTFDPDGNLIEWLGGATRPGPGA